MKRNKIALAVGTALLGMAGMVQAEISANIGATSNYIWRGQTQTTNEAAISGGIDWDSGAGFYAGTWASNVDFGTTGAEVDLYGGFAGEAGDFGYDVGLIYYGYPQHNNIDFTEVYGSVSFKFLEGGIYYTLDTEAGGADDHIYYYLTAGTDIADGWSISGTVGYYDIDGGSAADYTHYLASVTKSAGDFGDFTLSVSALDGKTAGGYDEDMLVAVSWGKSFN